MVGTGSHNCSSRGDWLWPCRRYGEHDRSTAIAVWGIGYRSAVATWGFAPREGQFHHRIPIHVGRKSRRRGNGSRLHCHADARNVTHVWQPRSAANQRAGALCREQRLRNGRVVAGKYRVGWSWWTWFRRLLGNGPITGTFFRRPRSLIREWEKHKVVQAVPSCSFSFECQLSVVR